MTLEDRVEKRVESSSPRNAVPARQEDTLERHRAETFNERLRRRWQEARTLLCVGLDGEIERMPAQFRRGLAPGETNGADEHERRIEAALTEYHIAIVEATADLVCAYKPNSAFYEQHGPAGLRALLAIIAYIQKKYPEIPVLLDAKRGDIDSTSQAYARALFDVYGADAVTAQPYLGYDALEPFLSRADRGVFVLCRTSNPGASELQNLTVSAENGEAEPLYLCVARRVATEWNAHGNCGLVVGATYPDELRQIRDIAGDLPILAPGIGAQGGDLEATVRAGLDSARQGLLLSASRSILYASSGDDFASAARRQAGLLRMEIERLRGGSGNSGVFRKAALASSDVAQGAL
jgi:orotidine-5'-phosphate decarboxylase